MTCSQTSGRGDSFSVPELARMRWRTRCMHGLGATRTIGNFASCEAVARLFDPMPPSALTLGSIRSPTTFMHPDLKAITLFLASTATPERGGLPYLDAVLPAEDRLAATPLVRDLGALPPDAILYLLAQPLLDLASDHLLRDRDLTARYEARFEVEDSDEWTAAMAEYNREADAITAALFRAQGEPGLA